MTNKQSGYLVFIAAIGMMLGLLALDIQQLGSWKEVTTPEFVAQLMGHLASVIAAFVGGKLIPSPQDQRAEDKENKK